MKIHYLFRICTGAVLSVVAITVIACTNPSGANGSRDSVERSFGTIRVQLPPEIALGAREVTTPIAQDEADRVEILIIDAPTDPAGVPAGTAPSVHENLVLDADPDLPAEVEIAVSPGRYRVLVLVGNRSGDTTCLLASGASAAPVEVAVDTVSEVVVVLATVAHAIVHPESVTAGADYEITLAGNTNNDLLTLDPVGTSATYRLQHRMDNESSYTACEPVVDGSAWSATIAMSAPVVPAETGWRFSGPYVTYRDDVTEAFAALDGTFSGKWRWLSCTVLSDDSPLWPEVWKPLSVVSSATGLTVQIQWP
jgi:hypothetical protein